MTVRERFLKSEHAPKLHALTDSDTFLAAADAALLVMIEEAPDAHDPAKGWDHHSRMIGARDFLETLKRLHESVESPLPLEGSTLHY